MQILIPDSWLREHLKTKASVADIAKYLSLNGPTVDRVNKVGDESVYDIEITTNRVDAMSVRGIAREAQAILPRFGIKASLTNISTVKPRSPNKSLPLKVNSNKYLVNRTIGVVLTNIKDWNSPNWMKKRLEAAGMRSLNSIVDITNYVMLEIGHPMHAFDYDKVPNATINIRESKKGEKIVSLENKEYKLPGGDIVFSDDKGNVFDLPGIIGTKNSIVTKSTKRVLLFIDNNEPYRIRNTSMKLGIRTNAAILNEKHVDPELGMIAILRAIELAKSVCKATVASRIYDSYQQKPKLSEVKVEYQFILNRLGVSIRKGEISKILKSLGFIPKWSGNNLHVNVPSFRSHDVTIAEDILEEVARIYGYNSLPGNLMEGALPHVPTENLFSFEDKIKKLIFSLGGIEVYTQSLVQKEFVDLNKAVKIKNPLGTDTEYLRTSLKASLIEAAKGNKQETEPFHLFELSSIYHKKSSDLPDHISKLGGIFYHYEYRLAKGVIETFLKRLNINFSINKEDNSQFLKSKRIVFKFGKDELGELGYVGNQYIYYSFDVESLRKFSRKFKNFISIPKYPPQTEDITVQLPQKTIINEVIQSIKDTHKYISDVELKDIYNDSYTFHIEYQSREKTLEDKEVEKIRQKILQKLANIFGVIVKS
ncbi:phenylalanine--tRNA ligase subunit beta [Candidatus Woesebacteria bacterium]|nr:phenylalanine--tRNA ligase subunit beta [Candidatus Woesebacteria bacterium]